MVSATMKSGGTMPSQTCKSTKARQRRYLQMNDAPLIRCSHSSLSYAHWLTVSFSYRCGIPSPILAAFMCKSKYFWGRRGTMIIGALVTMIFFFAYTQVSSNAGNLGYTCAITFCLVSRSICLPSFVRNSEEFGSDEFRRTSTTVRCTRTLQR